MACAEQLLQLQRLGSGPLKGIPVLAISPDPLERSRELIEKVGASRGVCLSLRFASDPGMEVAAAYGLKNPGTSGPLLRPATILYDRDGREVWRFVEKHTRMRPTDQELTEAVKRMSPR